MTALHYSKDEKSNGGERSKDDKKGEEEEEAEARRMEAVRSLQIAFYKSDADKTLLKEEEEDDMTESLQAPSSSSSKPNFIPTTDKLSMTRLEASTGRLHNLPLWRAPWWEVPYRSNVLNVHDPIYTNMFEQIVRRPKPWCFGHLYLEGGSENLRKGGLATWETRSECTKKSAVMGCIMHIQDYRRFSNGRLLLLVHALERFVVTDISQELPYSIVDAQILPDPEELDPSSFATTKYELDESSTQLWQFDEKDLRLTRGMAVQESVRYHDYEYDPEQDMSGISNKTYLELSDILWSSIAQLLPFCPFSKTLEPPLESEVKATLQHNFLKAPMNVSSVDEPRVVEKDEPQPSLESQLFQKGILQAPLFDPEYDAKYSGLSSDELEYQLWLAMNRYLLATKIPISPIVLGLLPRRDLQIDSNDTTNLEDWPADFQIYNIVRDLEATTVPANSTTVSGVRRPDKHDLFVRVHPNYPPHRRQKRLSYSALSLFDKSGDIAKQLRSQFLATPSTKQRMRLLLAKLDQWQEEFWGEFQ